MAVKYRNVILAFLLCGLLTGGLCMPVCADETEKDSTPEIESGIVMIETADDLCWFAEQVSAGVQYDAILMDDIDLTDRSFSGIGYVSDSEEPVYYACEFDGNDKTVTLNMGSDSSYNACYTALFSGLSEDGMIHDLTVSGSVYGDRYCAALVACADGGLIENVVSFVEVYAISSVAGGLVGHGENNLAVIGCANYGSVYTAGDGAGGIIGTAEDAVIIGCVNYGSVTAAIQKAGGIAATMADKSGEPVIAGCMNYGEISARYRAGGILAYSESNEMTIQYCGNRGAVTAEYMASSDGFYAGGVVSTLTGNATVNACYNAAKVSGTTYLGGVAGCIKGSSATLTNCYNMGYISTSGGYIQIGGVAAYTNVTAVVQNCYNTGYLAYDSDADLYSYRYIGAVIGYVSSKSSELVNTSNNYALQDIYDICGEIPAIDYNTAVTDSNAAYTDASALCDADDSGSSVLGEAYKQDAYAINDGYLILTWQGCTQEEVSALIEAAGSLDEIEFAFAAYYGMDEVEPEYSIQITDLIDLYNDYVQAAENVDKTISLINAIGEVTLARGDVITAARAAYDALSDEGKALVTNYDTLTEAEVIYYGLLADEVDALIEAIGEVTLESGDAITAAREAYDALSDEAKTYVENLAVLKEAESTYAALAAAEEVTEEETEEEAQTQEEEQTEADAQAQADAAAAEALIDAIGEVTPESGDTITAARTAYDALSDEAKALVSNVDTLEAAELMYEYLVLSEYLSSLQQPGQPSLKSVKNQTKGIKLTWTAADQAAGYYIYRRTGSGSFVLLAKVAGADTCTYLDKSVKNGKTYTYKVTAYNSSGETGTDSSTKVICRLKAGKIVKVKNKSGGKVVVQVQKNKKADGYRIVYSTSKNFKKKKTIKVRSYKKAKTIVKKLKKNKTYYFKVCSYKKIGSATCTGAYSTVKKVKVKK